MGKLEKMPKENILLDPILAALAQIWVVRIFFLFSWILPLLDIRNCCKLSLFTISRKTNEPNLRKLQKT